jgi:hypothetical protein
MTIVNLNKSNYSAKRLHKQSVNEIRDGYIPFILQGEYESVMTEWYTANIMGTPKVILLFTIVENGEYQNIIIPRFYPVKRLTSNPGMNGSFIAKPRGAFANDYYLMRPDAPRLRRDQIPMTTIQNKLMLITVGDVTTNSKQKEHVEQMKYSLVRKVQLI